MIIQGTLDENGDFIAPAKPTAFKNLGGDSGGGGSSDVVKIDATQNTVKVDSTTPVDVSGPLTNTELRAAPIPVSGPLTNAQLTAVTGTAAQTSITTDPSAAGQTMMALLRGILSEMQAQTALLNDIKTNTTPVEP